MLTFLPKHIETIMSLLTILTFKKSTQKLFWTVYLQVYELQFPLKSEQY